jgi:hypothetical protein
MTVLDLVSRQRVLVRAKVIEPYDAHCVVGIAKARNRHGDLHHIDTDFTEVVLPDYQVNFQLMRELENTMRLIEEQHVGQGDTHRLFRDRVLRLSAALYEGGCTPIAPLIKD